MPEVLAAETDAQPNPIRIDYYPPKNPTLQRVYDLVRKCRMLEKMQEIFSPFASS
jgi:hypothetical protein